jgi:hypothetical protein
MAPTCGRSVAVEDTHNLLGASLVSGAFVTVAIFGLQLASNLTAKEESFQLGIAW